VHGESVDGIPNWVRGEESLELLYPRKHKMALLGLGGSIGTGPEGVTAEAFVVSSFDDLKANKSKAVGKVVVFNAPWVSYGKTVAYRVGGADAASAVGGVAALVRSITPYSLYTPHTGSMYYSGRVRKVPTAAITVEDAEMLARMQARGQPIKLKLVMGAHSPPPTASRNILAQVNGSQLPDYIVLIGGHIDSWDVGQGAMDDGAGFFSAWEAVRIINNLIKQQKLPRPRRSIRVIGWVNEEMGARGAIVYKQKHQNELSKHQIAIESDSGNFKPTGFGFSGSASALSVMQNISALLAPLQADAIYPGQGADTDNGFLVDAGVPGGSLESEGFSEKPFYYFNYHHSNADTITSLNYEGVRASVAAFAVMAYVLADIPENLQQMS
jgi:carboxypeptidase Q